MFEALAEIAAFLPDGFAGAFLVFCRMAGLSGLAPGFGERFMPLRVRLAAAIALTAMVWPLTQQHMNELPSTLTGLIPLVVAETLIGAVFGILLRLTVLALQLAGSIAAQSVSVSQIMGAGATPDPMPALSNILTLAGLVLLMSSGLPLRIVWMLAESYQTIPPGLFPGASQLSPLGVAHVSTAFRIGLTIAIPFVLASLGYNIALGAINRAMPSLMVAFIGAPAITLGGLILLGFAGPAILVFWAQYAMGVATDPLVIR